MKPRRRSHALTREWTRLAMDAPQVMLLRGGWLSQAGATGLGAAEQAEWWRMHAEKAEALQAGWLAMADEWMHQQTLWWRMAADAWQAPWAWPASGLAAWQRQAEAVMAAGLAPSRRRTSANLRRLRRRAGPAG